MWMLQSTQSTSLGSYVTFGHEVRVTEGKNPVKKCRGNALLQKATAVVKNTQREIISINSRFWKLKSLYHWKVGKKTKVKVGAPEKMSVLTIGMNRSTTVRCKSSELKVCLKDGSVISMDETVVAHISRNVTQAPLSLDDTKFLKDESLIDQLVDTIRTTI